MLRCAMSDMRMTLRQLRSDNVTIRAFFEKIFQAEIYWATQIDDPLIHHKDSLPDKPLDMIKLLLESGQDPNCCLSRRTGGFITPIGRAINIGHVDLARLLLDFHVRINDIQADFDYGNVIYAILHGRTSTRVQLQFLKLLKEYKVVSLEEVLCGALKLQDMQLIEEILQDDIDVTKDHMEWPCAKGGKIVDIYNCLEWESPLTTALGVSCQLTKRLLDHPSVQKHPSEVLSAEIFIAAAIRGDCDIIRKLQELCPSGLSCKLRDITCLRAAVAYNNLSVVQFLLEHNGRASPDLLLIAAYYGYEDMVRLFLQHGLSTEERVSKEDVQWLSYFAPDIPIAQEFHSILFTLLKPRITDLNSSEANCLTLLIEAGARFLGGEISVLAEIGLQVPLEAALSRNADPNDQDVNGRTAIQCALYPDRDSGSLRLRHLNTRYRIIEVLLKAGAKQVGGEVVKAIRDQDYNLAKLLLATSGTLNDIDEKGASCLEVLIMNSNDVPLERAFDQYCDDHYSSFQRGTMISDSNVDEREILEVKSNATMVCSNCASNQLDSNSGERDLLQDILEAQDDAINAGTICAAIQVEDWDLLDRLLIRPHKKTNCHLLEGTAIGLAAKAGQMRILENLLGRFPHPFALQSGFIPFYLSDGQFMVFERDKSLKVFEWDTYSDERSDFWRRDTVYRSAILGTGSPLVLAALGADVSGFESLLKLGCCADKTTIAVVAQTNLASVYLGLLRKHSQRLNNLFPPQPPLRSVLLGPIRHGNIELVKELVDEGTDVNDYDPAIVYNRSPLQLAIELEHSSIVHYLIEKQADINAPPSFSEGATALQFAAIKGHMGIAKLLLDRDARINARGSRRRGRTALEAAAEYGRLDMLELLLHRGAAWTGYGRQQFISAVRLAMENAHYAAVDWLKDRYGWTEEDEESLNDGMDYWFIGDVRCKNCRSFCCDEIHGSEEDCIHYYPDEKEEEWATECYYCNLEEIGDYESQCEGDEASDQWTAQELEDDTIFFGPWVNDYSLFFD
ncbi:hypothetical protein BFJ63_vAg16865 [Fusarium oxysporum f. sp. narcissi]|uniref:Uncharacterized protein n=1 Tax=Fusarium oxysporum f. sp. narcissi TaxID=451672 RepID=A0A4Q2V154_FUSOX|nr:hypothetical protein BFJ63_vAg16865 [Fusarium oxysporum f. sp. narcissi]